jgi:hypothetical protein
VLDLLGGALGAGVGVAGLGLGGAAMMRGRCRPRQCRVGLRKSFNLDIYTGIMRPLRPPVLFPFDSANADF